jgi:hypothetical protein
MSRSSFPRLLRINFLVTNLRPRSKVDKTMQTAAVVTSWYPIEGGLIRLISKPGGAVAMVTTAVVVVAILLELSTSGSSYC